MSETYAKLMSAPEWREFRELVFYEKTDIECEQCQSTDAIHVHHNFYTDNHLPWEYNTSDVRLLCRDCHQQTHSMINNAINCVCALPIGPTNIKKVLVNITNIAIRPRFRDNVRALYDCVFYHDLCSEQSFPFEDIKAPEAKGVKPNYQLATNLKNNLFSKNINDLDRLELSLCRLYGLGDKAKEIIALTDNLTRIPKPQDNRPGKMQHVSDLTSEWFEKLTQRG